MPDCLPLCHSTGLVWRCLQLITLTGGLGMERGFHIETQQDSRMSTVVIFVLQLRLTVPAARPRIESGGSVLWYNYY